MSSSVPTMLIWKHHSLFKNSSSRPKWSEYQIISEVFHRSRTLRWRQTWTKVARFLRCLPESHSRMLSPQPMAIKLEAFLAVFPRRVLESTPNLCELKSFLTFKDYRIRIQTHNFEWWKKPNFVSLCNIHKLIYKNWISLKYEIYLNLSLHHLFFCQWDYINFEFEILNH